MVVVIGVLPIPGVRRSHVPQPVDRGHPLHNKANPKSDAKSEAKSEATAVPKAGHPKVPSRTAVTAKPRRASKDGPKDWLAQIEGVEPGDERFDAKLKVLSEHLQHPVREVRDEIFPKIKLFSPDTAGLGERLLLLREDLLARAA